MAHKRKLSRAAQQSAAYAATGATWTLTGPLLGGALLSMAGYLLVAGLSAIGALASGFDQTIGRAGPSILIPFVAAVVLVSSLMTRSLGHAAQEYFWGAVLMILMGPFVGMAVGYALHVDPAAVTSAGLAVGVSLGITALIAYLSPWDLTRLSGLAGMGLLGLLVTETAALFLAPVLGVVLSPWWSFAGIAVFELYLVVDFSRIRTALRYGPRTGLAAYLGLNLALDVINLFLFFLQSRVHR